MRTEPRSLQEFAEAVRAELAYQLSDIYPEIRPEIQQVEKTNGASYLGVRIDRGDGQAAPVINVEPYYQEAAGGEPFRQVMDRLVYNAADILQNIPEISTDHVRQYAEMKDNIIMQVIPIRGNEELLAGMPHREMEDMAVICRAMLGKNEQGEMSFLVTNPILQEYGISQEQLFADAAATALENNMYSVKPLFSVLAEMTPFGADEPVPEMDNGLYVATNTQKMFGAGVIAQPDFMEKAGEIMKGNFFILPSSIHEVLLLRDDGQTDFRSLEMMVKEINASQVAPHERLTDNVYHYDALEKVFETARHFSERQMEKEMGGRGSILQELADSRQRAQEHAPKPRSTPERGGAVL